MNISHITRKLWFPTAAGWAAYLLVFLLALLAMMGYPHNPTIISRAANVLCMILGPIFLLGGAVAHILSMVCSTRALICGTSERGEAIIAACLSWGWFVLACVLAVIILRSMYF